MQTSVTEEGTLGRKIHISIPNADIEVKVKQEIQTRSKKIRLDGFRPGKVPLKVVEERYGHEIFNDVVQDILRESYIQALQEENLNPAGQPKFENMSVARGQDISFDANIEIYPEFQAASMERASIEKPRTEITEDDIQAMLERVRKNQTQWHAVDRASQQGDRLTFDFSNTGTAEQTDSEDDKEPHGTGKGVQIILGEDKVPSQFSDQLCGVRSGETKTITVDTDNASEGDASSPQDKVYDVQVQTVEEGRLPELNDAFFKQCGAEEGGMDGLRKMLREGMERQLSNSLNSVTKMNVMNALLEVNTIEVPSALIKEEIERMKGEAIQRMQLPDADPATFPDDLFAKAARRRVELGLLLHQFSEQQNLTVDDVAFDAKVNQLAATYDEPEKVKQYYRNDRSARLSAQALAMEDIIVADVLKVAKITEKDYSFDEIVEAASQPEA